MIYDETVHLIVKRIILPGILHNLESNELRDKSTSEVIEKSVSFRCQLYILYLVVERENCYTLFSFIFHILVIVSNFIIL